MLINQNRQPIMILHRFNEQGIKRFTEYHTNLSLNAMTPPPVEWLEDPNLTEIVKGNVEIQPVIFSSRKEAGLYLDRVISQTEIDIPEKDAGLWTWLTLFFFDQVCPPDRYGKRMPRDEARLIPKVDNYLRFYRHLLLGPYLIIRAHRDDPERVVALLLKPLHEPGEIPEQLQSKLQLVTNRSIMEVATRLYVDKTTHLLKRGSSSKKKGAPRRLVTFLSQLDLTYYLYGLSADELIQLLPKEFDRFLK